MPNLLNGIVNGWVKVNSKHVIFPRDSEGHHQHHQARGTSPSSQRAPSSLTSGHGGSVLDRSRGKSSRNTKLSPSPTVSTASTQSSSHLDPEALAIKKFNSKKQNGRRLQRTVSHSDLLREMASSSNTSGNGGGDQLHHKAQSPARPSSTRGSRAASRETSYDSHRLSQKQQTDDESMRLVAGFFGSEAAVGGEKLSQRERRAVVAEGPRLQSRGGGGDPVTTGRYLNEAMFVQQLETSKPNRRSDASSAEGSFMSETSSFKLSSRSVDSVGVSLGRHEQDYKQHSEVSRIQPLQRQAYAAARAPTVPARDPHEGPPPAPTLNEHEDDLERHLLAAYEDIRYLRDVSLRREHNRTAPTKPKNSSGIPRASSKYEAATLADASKRLAEITGRHRRQIEQMTRENSRKQHDMHCKHSKVSMICKTLNDESSIRRQDALILEDEVRDLKKERDELATEVQRLRAEAHFFKQEQQEHALLRQRMTEYENVSLERATKAIEERDEMIADLTLKLERTMDRLQIEREQQRQRRQIIFPSSKSTTPQVNACCAEVADVGTLQEELRQAKEVAKASEALLESTRREAAKREVSLTLRCDNLESRFEKCCP